MQTVRTLTLALACCAATAAAVPAHAHEAGAWLVRGGFHNIDPKSDNGDIVEVTDDTMLTFSVLRMITDDWGVELLGALPFEHDIALVDGPRVGSVKHLPPTLSLVYYPLPEAQFQPYLGLGVNVTLFFDEQTRGPLRGSDLELDTSVGAAAVVGVDVDLGGNWFLNADVHYLDIETDASLDGAELETVKIDPWAFGLNVGYRF